MTIRSHSCVRHVILEPLRYRAPAMQMQCTVHHMTTAAVGLVTMLISPTCDRRSEEAGWNAPMLQGTEAAKPPHYHMMIGFCDPSRLPDAVAVQLPNPGPVIQQLISWPT
jgi:hypothetical protein